MNNDKNYIKILKEKIDKGNITEKEKAYLERILRVYNMPNLSEIKGHPVNMIINEIANSAYYKDFEHIKVPEIVGEFETFDLFYFPEYHVARRPSDSYFIEKNEKKEKSKLLRPHTTVMWYYYLLKNGGLQKLEKEGEIKVLTWGKVYRVDELDKTHHECFHQIDGFKIVSKEKEIITRDTLKDVLVNTIKSIYGENVNYRFHIDHFPYTIESLEVEIESNGKWFEVLGAGIVNPEVLKMLGIDTEKYSGWAFGFGIERLAMAMKKVPDIRIFWSDDIRITKQWGNWKPYKEISDYPPVYKDISFLVDKSKFIIDEVESNKNEKLELTKESESDLFEISGIVRDISGDIIEAVELIDIFENDKKFGNDKKSVCLKITFRSLTRTLTNEEINRIYFEIRDKIENELKYELR